MILNGLRRGEPRGNHPAGNDSTEAKSAHASAGVSSEVEEGRALARLAGLEFVDLNRFTYTAPSGPARAAVLPEQFARRNHVAPVGWERGIPVVAITTPENVLTLDDIRAAVGGDIRVVVASRSQIDHYLDTLYLAAPPSPPAAPGAGSAGALGLAVAEKADAAEAAEERSEREPADVATGDLVAGDNLDDIHLFVPGEPVPTDLPPSAEPPMVQDLAEFFSAAGADLDAHFDPPSSRSSGASPNGAGSHGAGSNGSGPASLAVSEDWFSDALRIPADALRLEDLELPEPPEDRPRTSIEELLVAWGKVSEADMALAVAERDQSGRSMREILAEMRFVSDDDLLHAVAVEAGFEFVDLNARQIDERAADLIPEAVSRRYKVIGIGFHGDRPVVGIANPFDVFALDDVRTVVGGEIEAVVCSPAQIDEYLGRVYRQGAEADLFARDAAMSAASTEAAAGSEVTNLLTVVDDAPIVKFVNLILRQALNQRASDVHIEPSIDNLQVRFRIDGVLHHVTSAPKSIQAGVTSRLKIMADLDIAEHRMPQDGRISLRVGAKEIDLRVATLPTVHGEKVALRVLDKSSVTLDLEKLGFQPDVLARYEAAYRKPYGTILVTGPTGSGKSTTLYATLSKLNSAEKNLITVEDPVEYQLRGINQVQVNPKAGLTFASALRSILRSDPDIVLVGEIRDQDTATTAVEAALTGHLVLTCLHTNDAAGTPMRLIEMGVEPFLVGSALDCVLGQRLARVLCNNCAQEYEPTAEDLVAAGFAESDWPDEDHGTARFRRAIGCQACTNTGYYGRMSIEEVMLVTEEIERAVITRAQSSEIQRIAVDQGMRTMRHDGLRKAALGFTSLEEILRVVV